MPRPPSSDRHITLRRNWAKARLLYHSVHDLGLPTIGHIVGNTLERRREGKDQRLSAPLEAPLAPGRRTGAHPIVGGVQVTFEHAALSIEFRAPDVVCLGWEPGLPPLPYAMAEATSWRAPAVEVTDAEAWT